VITSRVTRTAGLTGSLVYAVFIGWLYVRQPQTMAQVTGGITSGVGVYAIDRASF